MIEKVWHRSKFLYARRTAGYHDAVAALGDRWRLVNECGEVVSVEFGSQSGK